MRITVSHSGKQHSYHLARSLKRLGALDRFYTSSYITQPWLQRYFTEKGNTFFTRRFVEGLAAPDVEANWRFEFKEQWLRYRTGKSAATAEAVFQRDANFDHYVAGLISKRPSQAYWGFQGSAHDSLLAAKAAGKLAIVELATAHVTAAQRWLGEEKQLHPEWADSIDYLEFPAWYHKRLEQEPHVADVAIAASRFTQQTLLDDGIAANKIKLLPLGFELEHITYNPKRSSGGLGIQSRPLRLLYAGTITQRKGIKYLLEALKTFPSGEVELHCIGGVQGSGKALEEYKGLYELHGRISQYELFAAYQHYDALVLPTIFEGFGLVIVEAMAAGLPVITTPNSMGPDVVIDRQNGYLVPVRDVVALGDAISHLRSLNGEQYCAMSEAARQQVLNFTWQVYQQNLGHLISTLA